MPSALKTEGVFCLLTIILILINYYIQKGIYKMDVREVKEAVCGRDDAGKSKAAVVIGTHINNLLDATAKPEIIMECASIEPVVEIRVHGNFATIDFQFGRPNSEDLSQFFRCLERYLEEIDHNSTERQALSFITLLPFSLNGEYYISAKDPIFWTLVPDSIGDEPRTLRVVFYAGDVGFIEDHNEENILDAVLLQAKDEDDDDDDDDDLYNYIDDNEDSYYGDDDDDDYDERNEQFSSADKYMSGQPVDTDDPYMS